MTKLITVLCFAVGLLSCNNSEKELDKLKIAKQYYAVLDNSDTTKMMALLSDSLFTKETESDYEQTFSSKDYIEWLKWDAVFEPTYKILQIKEEDGMVKATISKIDKRIFFLHEEPMVTNEVIRFSKDKIISIERVEYVNFNETKFVKNRTELFDWIDTNHPDLNGFIHDQTKAGGQKYLKAIQLYLDRK